ncbi:MAG TPA: hypothetical protein IAC31_00285 [Candidatus Faecousia intestinigallinarum]|nr:hypothetical protein [Candidatus Faecousia intestinigallinarum]
MLYVTTRDEKNAYTAYCALSQERGADGGLFVPLRLPRLSREQINGILSKSDCGCIAEVLNLFYPARLREEDVEAAVGASPARLLPMSHRIVIAEVWQNPEHDLFYAVRRLAQMIHPDSCVPSDWAWISVRLAFLFVLVAQIQKTGVDIWEQLLDIAVAAGDFSAPITCWYAREMGLPVGNILCACNENSGLWDLFHYGQLRTDALAQETPTADADVSVPKELERLIFGALGSEETLRYSACCRQGKLYTLEKQSLDTVKDGFFPAVISRKRMASIIPGVYRANAYLLGPYSALAYGGLQDYRAAAGESRPALLLTERGPARDSAVTAEALGISQSELPAWLDRRG